MNTIVLVLGTPGVGKSKLGRSLARQLDRGFVDLGLLVRQERLYKRFDQRTKSYEIDERRVRDYIQDEFGQKRNIVIATHSIGRSIPSKKVRLAIVLRLDPVKLYRRLRARRWTRQKAWENTECELIDVCFEEAVRVFGKERVVEIDTTNLSHSRVLSMALAAVNVKRKFPEAHVDWLSVYDPLNLEKRLRWKSSTS